MGVLSFTLMRPSALLCTSLVLLVFLFPETCFAGKKIIPPVKHLFGVGIGYQKVVHYKPVLVISKSRRMKHRPVGWGWSGGGGGGRGGSAYKSYSPVVLEHHVHKHGKSGHSSHGHRPTHHHRRKRKRIHHHHPSHGHSVIRGWGWRRPHRSHRKGHGESGNRYHSPNNHHYQHYSSYSSSSGEGDHYSQPHHDDSHHHEISDHPSTGHHHEVSDHPSSGYHREISDHPTSGRHHQNHRDRDVWGGGGVVGGGGMVYPSHSANYYGSPYSDDIEEDHGGYESEIREQWKKGVPTTPSPPSSTTAISPTPPLFPFTEPPTSDGRVTNIHRDFLKNHMKNFHQFQEYQKATTTTQPRNDQAVNHIAPFLLRPPGPQFSTTDPQSSETEERGNNNVQYEDYSEEIRADGAENYDYYNGPNNNELKKKMIASFPQQSSLTTVQPTFPNNAMQSSNIVPQIITAMPKSDNFKPSPRVDQMGSGNSFSTPSGFFPL